VKVKYLRELVLAATAAFYFIPLQNVASEIDNLNKPYMSAVSTRMQQKLIDPPYPQHTQFSSKETHQTGNGTAGKGNPRKSGIWKGSYMCDDSTVALSLDWSRKDVTL